jgi:hypothetical protein
MNIVYLFIHVRVARVLYYLLVYWKKDKINSNFQGVDSS